LPSRAIRIKRLNRADLKSTETYLFDIATVLRLEPPRTVELIEIAKAGRYWATYRSGRLHKAERREVSRRFFRVARDWLQFEGLLAGSFTHRAYDWTAEYREATKSLGRLASATLESYADRVESFLKWFFGREGSRPFIVLEDVEDYIGSRGAEGWKPCTIPAFCLSLRNFLKYAETQGWCEAGLSDQVKSPRAPKFEVRKKGPHWAEGESSCDLPPKDRRQSSFGRMPSCIYWLSMAYVVVRSPALNCLTLIGAMKPLR